jgi:hypothetical protein
MFRINVRNADSVTSYEEAEVLFRTPLESQGYGWEEHMRPLDGKRKQHMRIEKGDGYYDAVLYKTAMARYFKPVRTETGFKRVVWYNTHDSNSSVAFQRGVLLVNPDRFVANTTYGTPVLVGMNPRRSSETFPVRLTYIKNKLDIDESQDAPAQIASITSAERKEQRKAFKKWLRPYEAMAILEEKGTQWLDTSKVKRAYEGEHSFDPTELVGHIKYSDVAKVINACYPLGDVSHFNPSFKEIE